ncbi:MAG: FAD-dependent oxidoreductase [Candidatus Omnitrophica bacterium]|nr:FAD-dependent oxidoreductase [Candidatus Omnitrophota bacterium]
MSVTLGSPENPLRVAVVGSGPSGFYAAESLLQSDKSVTVDMFERLPAPYGLVRYGVAPDHSKIKNVIKIYERIAEKPGFSFLGNVNVGKDVSVRELKDFYDVVLLAYGAPSDRKLGIPGEDLPGSYTATEFVAWYNGHPDYRDRKFDLSGKVAVVIGQGNVAADVCRILCKTPEELKNTDIASYALEVLAQSKIQEVHMVGRRGPAQAAFTPVEIREFGELADCDPVVSPAELELNPASRTELEIAKELTRKKNIEILREFVSSNEANPRRKFASPGASSKRKKFFVRFLRSPVEIKGSGRVERIVLEKNRLEGEPGRQKAKGTGEKEEMACGLLFRSVGYHGVPAPGVPFDERAGVIPNQEGRVTESERVVPGFYAAGWIKRGPTGVIGTNKADSNETVRHILEDAPQLPPATRRDTRALLESLKKKGVRVVSFPDWKRIDAREIARGVPAGKPREKFTSVTEMLSVLEG